MRTLGALVSNPGQGELALRLVLALVLGGGIGLEREIEGHPAGLRTHISVALGAALFGLVSAYGFEHFQGVRADTNYQIDVTRVASQVVVGVGFLGGGAILKEGITVRGLTTAASLWVTAAIGLAVALGVIAPALVTTGLLLGALVLLRAPRRWLRYHVGRSREAVLIRLKAGADPSGVIGDLNGIAGITLKSLRIAQVGGTRTIEAAVKGDHGVDVEAVLAVLADRDDVADLDIA